MVVGIGRLLGLHLLEAETTPGQMKPTGPLESWAGAEAWVGCKRDVKTASRVPEGSGGQGRHNPLRFPYLLFTCTDPPNAGDTFLPVFASPPLCPWQDGIRMGGACRTGHQNNSIGPFPSGPSVYADTK